MLYFSLKNKLKNIRNLNQLKKGISSLEPLLQHENMDSLDAIYCKSRWPKPVEWSKKLKPLASLFDWNLVSLKHCKALKCSVCLVKWTISYLQESERKRVSVNIPSKSIVSPSTYTTEQHLNFAALPVGPKLARSGVTCNEIIIAHKIWINSIKFYFNVIQGHMEFLCEKHSLSFSIISTQQQISDFSEEDVNCDIFTVSLL